MEIIWSYTLWVAHYWVWKVVFHCCKWSVFYCFSSYSTLLELHYGGRVPKSWIAQEQVKETGTSVREAKHQIGHRAFSWWIPLMGTRYSTPVSDPSWNVFACCWQKAEGGGNAYSAGATGAAPWDQICRWAHLLWSWWGIRHPVKKFETSIKVFTCYRGY